ncbi:MAG: transporter substrate-binding domain-containing protein [Cellvibrionaceae bacterium]
MKIQKTILLLFLFLYSLTTIAEISEPIIVGTIERPPFSTQKKNGEWTGFSIEVLQAISERTNLRYTLQPQTVFADMLSHVETGNTDMAVANISVTSSREAVMDFSQPIYVTGLQILTRADYQKINYWKIIWESGILIFLAGALFILLIVAHLMWFFERGEDAKHDYFRDEYFGGIWDAFWWAFVICTMGGFEKERPEHIIGRVIAVFWILASLFFISTLTAKITSALTVAELSSSISHYDDLRGKKIGAPKGTTISEFLDKQNIHYTEYSDFSETLVDLENKKLDAIVGDAAVSRYYAQTEGQGKVATAGEVFAKSNIAFAFSEESPYFEAINRALINMQEDGSFAEIQQKYFGQ